MIECIKLGHQFVQAVQIGPTNQKLKMCIITHIRDIVLILPGLDPAGPWWVDNIFLPPIPVLRRDILRYC